MRKFDKDDTRSKESLVPAETLSPGVVIDHYKVLRAIGAGGMGEVYLARDTLLGRKVALKLVHAEAIDTKSSVDRFLFEARATARFNHPHIITIYGVGAYEERPYVALEYLEGQTLFERLSDEPPSLKESIRIGLAVAEALQEAHANNILHRDLKPENIFLPKDGRLRVLDFGLAKAILGEKKTIIPQTDIPMDTVQYSFGGECDRSHEGFICGTPMYMPPEQWAEHTPTGATDIWAWGMILYELLTGERPYDEPTVLALCAQICSKEPVPAPKNASDIPTLLFDLLTACLDKDPEKRPTAKQVADELRGLVYYGQGHREGETNPFRGLLPFTERQAGFYFGRIQEVDEFLEKLRTESLLPIVGPSGVGKSSFVQAGIIPRLKENGRWTVIGIRPGRHPFDALTSRIFDNFSKQTATGEADFHRGEPQERDASTALYARKKEDFAAWLLENPGHFSSSLQQLADEKDTRILLFVDQMEELFTLVENETIQENFIESICQAAFDAEGRVKVVFTLRDDFLVRLATSARTRNALGSITVLRRLTRESLKEILTLPLQAIGYSFDDATTVPEMISHVHGEPAALPLLQFTCQMLWEHRDKQQKLLLRETYNEIGGVVGALAHHADGMLEGLSTEETLVAKAIFLRLVTEDGTRKILPRFALVEGLQDSAETVLNRMIQARSVLVRKGHGISEDDAEVEIIHESLIREWGTLAKWLEEGRDEIAFLSEIGMAAELWDRRGRRKDEVWQGAALHDAIQKTESISSIPDPIRCFLDAGLRLEKLKNRSNGIIVAIAFSILVVIAVVLSLQVREANRQRERAERERFHAETQRAEALREGVKSALLKGNLVEARAKLRLSLETVDSPLARALYWRLRQNPINWTKRLGTGLTALAFDPSGHSVATAGDDGMIYLIDLKTQGAQIVPGQRGVVTALSYSPSGRELSSGFQNGIVQAWSLETGKHRSFPAHKSAITSLAYDPKGRVMATAGTDKTIRIWDVATGKQMAVLEEGRGRVESLHIGPNDLLVSGGSDKTVKIWNLKTFDKVGTLKGHTASVTDVSFSPRGDTIASSSWDHTIRVWNTQSHEPLKVLRGHTDTVESVSFRPDGKQLATGSSDRTIRTWDLESGEETKALTGHTGFVYRVRYGPKGNNIASVSSDETIRLWKTNWHFDSQVERGHTGMIVSAEFNSDGSSIITGSVDKSIRFWDTETGMEKRILKGLSTGRGPIAVSQDGKLLATTGQYDNTVQIFDLASGARLHVLKGHTKGVVDMEFNRQATILATASKDSTISIWNVKTGRKIDSLSGHKNTVTDVSFSPDNSVLASASSDNTIRLWHMGIKLEPRVLRGHTGTVYAVAFDPKGNSVASGSADGTARLWNIVTQRVDTIKKFDAKIYDVAFHPNGNTLGLALSDRTAHIVNLAKGDDMVLKGHTKEVVNIRFHPSRNLAITGGADGTLRTWDISSGRPFWRAPFLLKGEMMLYTHKGRYDFSSGKGLAKKPRKDSSPDIFPPGFAQNTAIASKEDGGPLFCAYGYNGMLTMIDIPSRKVIFEEKIPSIKNLLAAKGSCVLLSEKGVVILRKATGDSKLLCEGATAIATDKNAIIVAINNTLRIYDENGNETADYPTLPGVTAITRIWPWLVVGRQEGKVDFIPIVKGTRQPDFNLDHVPTNTVRQLTTGPEGTLVAGYDNGTIGVFSLENGMLLHKYRLHGPISHLYLRENQLLSTSVLGDFQVLDFEIFHRDYCDMLREIWKEVPIIWSAGKAVEQAPPKDHYCYSH